MSEEKSIRLSKIARELNIGISTIVDFLSSKGHKVDSNPNAKVSEDLYGLLLKEFQSEKTVKEQSQSIKIKKESVVLDAAEAKQTKEKDQDEVLIKNLPPVEIESKAKTREIPAEKEVLKPQVEKLQGPTIVNKIDLPVAAPKAEKGKKGTKTEKAKKEEETAAKSKGRKKKTEEVGETAQEAPVAEAPAPVAPEAAPAPEPPAAPEPKQDVLYVPDREKLTGPTIVGKINLPVEPPKQKLVASSSPAFEGKKKKRKRTDKRQVNPEEFSKIGDKPDFKKRDGGKVQGGRRNEPTRNEISDKEIQDQIRATLARLSGGGKSKSSRYRKIKREAAAIETEEQLAAQEAEKKTIKVTEFVSASELAKLMNVPVTDIISTCMSLGIFVSINQRLDAETLTVVAEEFGFKVEFVTVDMQDVVEEEADDPADLKPRSPIVTVMGHVDHGKTSLLDYIRKANVIAGEAGGITQHIGAYEVQLENGKKITFLDTPGHEAFTAMRARGAKVTDVAIIVIAADDSVMPQTVEAINHAAAANVPIVFAINKIDKDGANPEKIKEQLANMKYLVEDWGGKFQCQEISAKKGLNVNQLLEKVLLESELLDLKANPHKRAVGTVIESSLDKGRGYVTTLLVQTGTLQVGDVVLAGCHSGKVKALFNERGQRVIEAGPASPVLMLGMTGAPQAGDKFNVMNDEREAREIANKRLQLQREQSIRTHKHITLDEIGRRLAIGNFKELNIIVKGDVDGSVEALSDSLLKLSNSEIQVNVIHKSVGQISESDVLLASASNAIIIGFQVRPSLNARRLAEQEQIDIRLYSIIYDAINELKAAMEGMLAPEFEEKITGNIEVREVFKITKVGTVAGCMVLDGKVTRNTKVRVVRNGIVVYSGELSSLKRFKDDVKEVSGGYECGLSIQNFNDIKVGDIIEGYEQVAVKRTL